MKRRQILAGLAFGVAFAAAGPALALSYTDDIVAQLTGMGFIDIDIETTWLGRVRILASRGDGLREIVLNPRTGEILRDVWTPSSGDGTPRRLLDDVDDDGDNDRGDDGKDDDGKDGDNSGPGGGGDDVKDERDDKKDDRDRREDRRDD